MKKNYQTPKIFFEDFTLMESIASDCTTKVATHTDGFNCFVPVTDSMRLFAAGNASCTEEYEDSEWGLNYFSS